MRLPMTAPETKTRGRDPTPRGIEGTNLCPAGTTAACVPTLKASDCGIDQIVKNTDSCRRPVREERNVIHLKYSPTRTSRAIGANNGARARTASRTAPTTFSLVASVIANPCIPESAFRESLANMEIKSTRKIDAAFSTSSITNSNSSTSTESFGSDEDHSSSSPPSPADGIYSPSTFHRRLRSTSNDSAFKPPPSCDLVVTVGSEDFFYSSSILKNTCNYLNTSAAIRDKHGRYYINFSRHTAEEWRPVVGFLQSYLVDAAELSWRNFPDVLPWFHELGMEDLLVDADAFLFDTAVASQGHRKEYRMPISSLLLLVNIAFTCRLEFTMSRSKEWLKAKLQEPQSKSLDIDEEMESDGEGMVMNWSLQDLQTLSELLHKFEDLRDYLWDSTVIMYLPHDLNVENSLDLVGNSLFPYLLREGMMQLVALPKEDMPLDGLFDEGSKPSHRAASPAPTFSSDTTMPTNHVVGALAKMVLPHEVLIDHLETTMGNLARFEKIRQDNHLSHRDAKTELNRKLPRNEASSEKQTARDKEMVVGPVESGADDGIKFKRFTC